MVSHNSSNNNSTDFIAGGISGGTTRFFVAPLDVVKIRFQVQATLKKNAKAEGSIPVNIKYRTVWQTIGTIIKEEGFTALWKGNLTGTFLWISFSGVQFGAYQQVLKRLRPPSKNEGPTYKRLGDYLLSGGFAGFVATYATYPLDLVRTRLASQIEPKKYLGMIDCFSKILKADGPKGLFRGVVPTTLEIIPYIALQFTIYEESKNFYKRTYNVEDSEVGPITQLCCGAIAGTLSKLVVLPLDTIKKRMQVSGVELGYGHKIEVHGVWDCAKKIAAKEGFRGFYKGTVPSLYKAVSSGINAEYGGSNLFNTNSTQLLFLFCLFQYLFSYQQ
eukprot:TRINITY_DN5316_c0_g1_i3.p1 TRINITY_DN5316_c0_g1~~TRINITY_DN5316_c0_g1_i3.p1  ORF type:complete len:331 (+),score=70.86 TRINITY_DN5316_c0_g1_i3:157-1149(+)